MTNLREFKQKKRGTEQASERGREGERWRVVQYVAST